MGVSTLLKGDFIYNLWLARAPARFSSTKPSIWPQLYQLFFGRANIVTWKVMRLDLGPNVLEGIV